MGEDAVLRVGPPQRLRRPSLLSAKWCRVADDGRLLVATNSGVSIFDPVVSESGVAPLQLVHPGVWYAAGSSDGRWAATAVWNGRETRVWDARRGKLVAELPSRSARVGFSPDSKYLLISAPDGYSVFRTGDWQLVQRMERVDSGIAMPMAFSRDGRLLAIAPSQTVELYEFPSCRELATLCPPLAENIDYLCFSPAADRLVVKNASGAVHVWDLRPLRERLRADGLDWETPDYPPGPSPQPLVLSIELGEFMDIERYTEEIARNGSNADLYLQRGLAHRRFRQFQPAIDDFSRAIELKPDYAEAYFERGRVRAVQGQDAAAIQDFTQAIPRLAECTEAYRLRALSYARLQMWREAAEDFQRLIEQKPSWMVWYELGLARCHTGQWQQAVESLSHALALGSGNHEMALTLSLRGTVYRRLDRFRESLDDLTRAWELKPDDAAHCSMLARALAAYPDSHLRDPERSVSLAKSAIKGYPLHGPFWNTLGLAYYRQGDYAQSLEALREAMRLRSGGECSDWLLFAMSLWKINAQDDARNWYQKAIHSIGTIQPDDQELEWLRAEADALIELK
jgi:tetratricopeptide (TPR) repeat protein